MITTRQLTQNEGIDSFNRVFYTLSFLFNCNRSVYIHVHNRLASDSFWRQGLHNLSSNLNAIDVIDLAQTAPEAKYCIPWDPIGGNQCFSDSSCCQGLHTLVSNWMQSTCLWQLLTPSTLHVYFGIESGYNRCHRLGSGSTREPYLGIQLVALIASDWTPRYAALGVWCCFRQVNDTDSLRPVLGVRSCPSKTMTSIGSQGMHCLGSGAARG